MIVTFCGHADYVPSEHHEKMILDFLEEKIGDRPAEFYLGGYGNFDRFALLCGKKFQSTHPNTKLIFVTPYLTDDYLKSMEANYDGIVYPPLERVPKRFAISRRNRWMAEQADYMVAYVTRSWGGAFQAMKRAQLQKKEIYNLYEGAD